jgi:hypothetical protein
MSVETLTKISSTTVGAGGSSTITFTGIPQDYTDLRLTLSGRGTESNYYTNFIMTFNSSTTSDYTFIRGIGIGSGLSGDGPFTSQSSIYIGEANAATSTANSFCHFDIHIGNYAEPQFKPVSIDKSQTNNSTTAYIIGITGAAWLNTAPITSITLSNTSGVFAQYSTATLYGVKNFTKLVNTKKPYVTGGTLTSDSQYYYRTFTSSGTLSISNGNLISDTLIVAGGGSGGGSAASGYYGGGGGAGGLVGFTNTPLSGDVSVVVGAGGASSAGTNLRGNKGSNSAIGSTIALGGGGGGGGSDSSIFISANKDGGTGGSGGGGQSAIGTGSLGAGTGGAGTIGQGNSGGSGAGAFQIEPQAGGGGGGAGAAGSNATSAAVGGAGGVGSSAYSSWGLATGTGQLSSGTYYYAGGGGGASNGTAGAGGLGGGGAGGGATGANGTANTGGGSGNGMTGGSGIVIIRYTKSQVL